MKTSNLTPGQFKINIGFKSTPSLYIRLRKVRSIHQAVVISVFLFPLVFVGVVPPYEWHSVISRRDPRVKNSRIKVFAKNMKYFQF